MGYCNYLCAALTDLPSEVCIDELGVRIFSLSGRYILMGSINLKDVMGLLSERESLKLRMSRIANMGLPVHPATMVIMDAYLSNMFGESFLFCESDKIGVEGIDLTVLVKYGDEHIRVPFVICGNDVLLGVNRYCISDVCRWDFLKCDYVLSKYIISRIRDKLLECALGG